MTPQEALTELRRGQSLYLVFPTHRQAKIYYHQLQDLHPKDVDFIPSQLAVMIRSTNQMKLDVFAKLVTVDIPAETCRGAKAIVRFPYPIPRHMNFLEWEEEQRAMERHRVC